MKFIIDQTFQIEGRGCVVAFIPSEYKKEDQLNTGDPITIEKENGEKIQTKVIGVEMIKRTHNAPKMHQAILVENHLKKEDIPLQGKLYKTQKDGA